VGLYVDVANLAMNGGFGMRYDVLREFACRGDGEPIRLNAYVSFDADRAERDPVYRSSQLGFHSALRDFGYKVILKRVRWYTDEAGREIPKANVDLDMAVDALLQSENIDRVILATGDGDFVQVVRALQDRGCRVEIIAFDNVSTELRQEADSFVSGYLIPNLLSIPRARGCPPWGQVGSYARGVCYHHEDDKSFGFIRYLATVEAELWRTDTRQANSPYRTVFCHDSELPEALRLSNRLPSRDVVLEFKIVEGEQGKGNKAVEVVWVNPRHAARPPLAPLPGTLPPSAPPPPVNGDTPPEEE
jgi:hypothetical protein